MKPADSAPNPHQSSRSGILANIGIKIGLKTSNKNSNKSSTGRSAEDELAEFQLGPMDSQSDQTDDNKTNNLPVPNMSTAQSLDNNRSNTKNQGNRAVPNFGKYLSDRRGLKKHKIHHSANLEEQGSVTKKRHSMRLPIVHQLSKSGGKLSGISSLKARMSEKLSGIFKSTSVKPSDIDTDLNEIAEGDEEDGGRKSMTAPKPKDVGMKDFVHIVNEIIQVVQSLNHQSISRWRKTEEFRILQEQIDLSNVATHLRTPTTEKSGQGLDNLIIGRLSNVAQNISTQIGGTYSPRSSRFSITKSQTNKPKTPISINDTAINSNSKSIKS